MVEWDKIDFDKVDNAELDVGIYWMKLEIRLTDKFTFIHYFTDKESLKKFVDIMDESPVYYRRNGNQWFLFR